MDGLIAFTQLLALIAAWWWLFLAGLTLKLDSKDSGYGKAYLALWPETAAKFAVAVVLASWGLGFIAGTPSWFRLSLVGLALPVAMGDLLLAYWRRQQAEKARDRETAGHYELGVPSRVAVLTAARWLTVAALPITCLATVVFSANMMIHYGQDPSTWIPETVYVLGLYVVATTMAVWFYGIGHDLWESGLVPVDTHR